MVGQQASAVADDDDVAAEHTVSTATGGEDEDEEEVMEADGEQEGESEAELVESDNEPEPEQADDSDEDWDPANSKQKRKKSVERRSPRLRTPKDKGNNKGTASEVTCINVVSDTARQPQFTLKFDDTSGGLYDLISSPPNKQKIGAFHLERRESKPKA